MGVDGRHERRGGAVEVAGVEAQHPEKILLLGRGQRAGYEARDGRGIADVVVAIEQLLERGCVGPLLRRGSQWGGLCDEAAGGRRNERGRCNEREEKQGPRGTRAFDHKGSA